MKTKDEIKQLITDNIGSIAKITVRSEAPVEQVTVCHLSHLRMVDQGWIFDIEVLPKDATVMIGDEPYEIAWLHRLGEKAKKSPSSARLYQRIIDKIGWDEFYKQIEKNKKK